MNKQKQNIDQLIAQCFDYQYISQNTSLLESLQSSNQVTTNSNGAWTEIFPLISQIFSVQNEKDAFKLYIKAITPVIRNFKQLDANVSVLCLKTMAKSLKYFSETAEYNESVTYLQKLLPLSMAYQRKKTGESALLYVGNNLILVNFSRNNFKQAQNVIEVVEEKVKDLSNYPINEAVEFSFNKGKINAVYSKLQEAQKDLLFAFHHTPYIERKNRRLILAYLVPVQMCLGQLPSKDLINKYSLTMYEFLAKAIETGNLALYDESLESNQFLFIKLGLFDLVVKARQLVFLQILKVVHNLWGDAKVPTTLFQEAISKYGDYDFVLSESIIASLIKEGYVKAYMSHPLKKIVFSQTDPFPNLDFNSQ